MKSVKKEQKDLLEGIGGEPAGETDGKSGPVQDSAAAPEADAAPGQEESPEARETDVVPAPGAEGQPDPRDARIARLEQELDRVRESTQRRIDELTAEKYRLRGRAGEAESEAGGPEPLDRQLARAQAELGQGEDAVIAAQERIAEAKLSGDPAEIEQARTQYREALRRLRAAEEALSRLRRRHEDGVMAEIAANARAFTHGLSRAVQKYPHIADEAGRLHEDHPAVKRAVELLREGAKPSRIFFDAVSGRAVFINPRYDHVDGQYSAVRDAMDELGEDPARLAYEKNLLSRRLVRERSKRLDPVNTRAPVAGDESVSALERQMEKALGCADAEEFDRLRRRKEELIAKRKEK